MSLDVDLMIRCPACECCGRPEEHKHVYEANITHNLNKMAAEAGMYEAVWHPNEHGYTHAGQIIPILEQGIAQMEADPPRFEAFNSLNGWGLYKHFLPWLKEYLEACRAYPEAEIRTDT